MRKRSEVGENIHRLCLERGINLQDLAKKIGVDYETARNMLVDDKKLTLYRLHKIADVLECSLYNVLDANVDTSALTFTSSHKIYPWTLISAAIRVDPEGLDLYEINFPKAKECFDNLTKRQRYILIKMFLKNKTVRDLTEETSLTYNQVRKAARAGLVKFNKMLRDRCMMVLKEEQK